MIQNHKKILAPIDFSEYSMEALRGAEELARIKKDDYGNSAKVFTQVMVGPPVPKLVEYAKQQQIDLILLATHGRTGSEHLKRYRDGSDPGDRASRIARGGTGAA